MWLRWRRSVPPSWLSSSCHGLPIAHGICVPRLRGQGQALQHAPRLEVKAGRPAAILCADQHGLPPAAAAAAAASRSGARKARLHCVPPVSCDVRLDDGPGRLGDVPQPRAAVERDGEEEPAVRAEAHVRAAVVPWGRGGRMGDEQRRQRVTLVTLRAPDTTDLHRRRAICVQGSKALPRSSVPQSHKTTA